MNRHGPHDQRRAAHWLARDDSVDTFTLRLPAAPTTRSKTTDVPQEKP